MMHCRPDQAPHQIAYAVAGMIVVAQPAYSMRSDDTNVRFARVKSQSTSNFSVGHELIFLSPFPASFDVIPDEMRFSYFAKQWLDESAVMSSTTEMVMTQSYQRILGMGEKAVPLILKRLEAEGDQPENWFWALRSITGQNPVAPELRGNRRAMAAAWLDWGRSRYAW
jgi:hypothetical protein